MKINFTMIPQPTGRTIRRKDYVNPVKIINNLNSKLKT